MEGNNRRLTNDWPDLIQSLCISIYRRSSIQSGGTKSEGTYVTERVAISRGIITWNPTFVIKRRHAAIYAETFETAIKPWRTKPPLGKAEPFLLAATRGAYERARRSRWKRAPYRERNNNDALEFDGPAPIAKVKKPPRFISRTRPL